MFITTKTGIHSSSWYLSILDRRKSTEIIYLNMTRDSVMNTTYLLEITMYILCIQTISVIKVG